MSKLRQRLQKMGTVQSMIMKAEEILNAEIDNILNILM
jgi:hypothetical protein